MFGLFSGGDADQGLAAEPGHGVAPPHGGESALIRCLHNGQFTPDLVAKRGKNGGASAAVHREAGTEMEHFRRGTIGQRGAGFGVELVAEGFEQGFCGGQ